MATESEPKKTEETKIPPPPPQRKKLRPLKTEITEHYIPEKESKS